MVDIPLEYIVPGVQFWIQTRPTQGNVGEVVPDGKDRYPSTTRTAAAVATNVARANESNLWVGISRISMESFLARSPMDDHLPLFSETARLRQLQSAIFALRSTPRQDSQ
jgi:hypothetical protein